jgi:hypothetical protein
MQLAGELSKISLSSLIQLLRNGELTGKICLTQGANTAFMYVDKGRLKHVETDAQEGTEALLELFLWVSGSFSFLEAPVDAIQTSIPPDEPIEKLIKEGVAYLEQKKYLDHLRVTPRTILAARGSARQSSDPILPHLDGKTPLKEICDRLQLERRAYVSSVYHLLSKELATVVQKQTAADQVKLPGWVISRLQQDNPDLTQAIVEMVIWVDRVKCWMYQADADLDRVISEMDQSGKLNQDAEDSEEQSADDDLPMSGQPYAASTVPPKTPPFS